MVLDAVARVLKSHASTLRTVTLFIAMPESSQVIEALAKVLRGIAMHAGAVDEVRLSVRRQVTVTSPSAGPLPYPAAFTCACS